MAPETSRIAIVRGVIGPATWTLLGDTDALPADGSIFLPLARWLAGEAEGRTAPTGILLRGGDDARKLAGRLEGVQAIAVAFPKFGDGRGYSHARILREELGYTGELRAVGDVLRDQAFLMARCGFDAFEPAPGLAPESFLAGLEDFSVRYQPAADEALPVWRRAARPAAG